MPLRISNLHVGLEESDSELPGRLASVLGLTEADFSYRILRKSLDIRKKSNIHFVYSAEVSLRHGISPPRLTSTSAKIEPFDQPSFSLPNPGAAPMGDRPVVVGSGPAGLTAAYFLAEAGYRPLLLERGHAVSQRIRDVREFDAGGRFDPAGNYLFGEGGAGTFSDGKLTTRSTGADVLRVLQMFADSKGKPSVLYEHRPHLGSNRLPAVVKAMRQHIEAHGGEVRFGAMVTDIDVSNGAVSGLYTSAGRIPCGVVILAIGHSARDTFAMLLQRGVPLEQKPFQMGLRVEHPQSLVNRVQYGSRKLEQQLGNADYSLVAHGRHDVFTFCMCAGGYIIPSVSETGYFCTNGMSLSRRDSYFANSGLVVTVPTEAFPGADPLAGIRLQEQFERAAFDIGGGEYRCPVQRADDFLANRVTASLPQCSYPRGIVPARLDQLVPPLVSEAIRAGLPLMDRRWQGKFLPEAVLVGPEARGSSPVRIVRGRESRESPGITGLFPVGEGAGYAGGIVSAAVDGLLTAKTIIAKFVPPS